jgi:hypothetical protein
VRFPARRTLVPALAAVLVVGALAAVAARAQGRPAPTPTGAPAAAPAANGLARAVGSVVAAQGGATWQPLPEVATYVREAVAGLTEDPLEAAMYGDASMGCFVLALRLGSGGVALHHALRDALASTKAQAPVTASDWTMASDAAAVRSSFAFTADALRGEVRVLSRGVTPPAADTLLATCFFNTREPERAARLCKRMLPAIEDALYTVPETFP